MHHPEFPIVSFLCFLMVISVLPSHLRAGSVATAALIVWLSTMSLIRGINSLVWADNFDIKIPVWCDITTKLSIGFTFAVPAAALCVLKHLESIASARTVRITPTDKRRRQIFEGIMCFALPALFMALHYIVQGHRFDIYEDIGCQFTVYYSIAGIFLYYGPPLLMSSLSFVFAALSIYHFLRLRINFSLHLRKNDASISPNRYFRLMAMAIVVNMWDAGINTYTLIFTNQLSGGLRPWISWANVHSNWSFIAIYPIELFSPALYAQVIFVWWIVPISCFIFFLFFGFGSEVQSDYRAAVTWIWTKVLRQKIRSSIILPISHVAIRTPASLPNSRKAWDDSESTLSNTRDLNRVTPVPVSRTSSMISPPSPTLSSSTHELTPVHPYAILPDASSATTRPHDPRDSQQSESQYSIHPEAVDASHEMEKFRTYVFPRNKGHIEGVATTARLDVPEDVATTSSPASGETPYSIHSHDVENQDFPPREASSNRNDNGNPPEDYVVISKTLSIDFVPRVL